VLKQLSVISSPFSEIGIPLLSTEIKYTPHQIVRAHTYLGTYLEPFIPENQNIDMR
jgi:hypothetical protein